MYGMVTTLLITVYSGDVPHCSGMAKYGDMSEFSGCVVRHSSRAHPPPHNDHYSTQKPVKLKSHSQSKTKQKDNLCFIFVLKLKLHMDQDWGQDQGYKVRARFEIY